MSFNPSWSGALSLKSASGAQIDVPTAAGSGYVRNTPNVPIMVAQGGVNPFAVNGYTGRKFGRLVVQTYGFASLLSSTALGAFIGRDASGDLTPFSMRYSPRTGETETDTIKMESASIRIDSNGAVVFGFSALGLGGTAAFTGTNAFTATNIDPLAYRDVTLSFGPVGTATLVDDWHSAAFAWNTGAHYASVMDGLDHVSYIDPGIINGTSFSIVQRPEATNRVASSASGEFTVAFAGAGTIKLQATRQSVSKMIDPFGAALDVSAWTFEKSLNGSSPISVS